MSGSSSRSWGGRLAPLWRGHVLWFERPARAGYSPATGNRLLLIVFVLEAVVGPRFSLFRLLGIPIPPQWVRIPVLLVVALLLVRFYAGLRLSEFGLRPWRQWSAIERWYFVQVLLLANIIFGVLFAERLRTIAGGSVPWSQVAVVSIGYLVWGFYQELIYRGSLQTELVRRWGVAAGILVSNALYTFGPLHFYHFSRLSGMQALAMFAGIFAIGMFFALVYRRSGNLWMVGVFHGLGDCYITGLATLTR